MTISYCPQYIRPRLNHLVFISISSGGRARRRACEPQSEGLWAPLPSGRTEGKRSHEWTPGIIGMTKGHPDNAYCHPLPLREGCPEHWGVGQKRQVTRGQVVRTQASYSTLPPELEQWDGRRAGYGVSESRRTLLGTPHLAENLRNQHDVRNRYQEGSTSRRLVRESSRGGLWELGHVTQGASSGTTANGDSTRRGSGRTSPPLSGWCSMATRARWRISRTMSAWEWRSRASIAYNKNYIQSSAQLPPRQRWPWVWPCGVSRVFRIDVGRW